MCFSERPEVWIATAVNCIMPLSKNLLGSFISIFFDHYQLLATFPEILRTLWNLDPVELKETVQSTSEDSLKTPWKPNLTKTCWVYPTTEGSLTFLSLYGPLGALLVLKDHLYSQ